MQEFTQILLVVTLSVTVAIVWGERCHVWWMTESGIAIIVGMVVGLIWYVQARVFSDDVDSAIHECARRETPNLLSAFSRVGGRSARCCA